MDNKIIGGTVSTTFPVPTKISDLVDDMHIEETNKSVKVLLDTTELKMNKVDAFVDAEDESKAYPSVFGVKAYGEDLKAKIGEKYDYQLDNKVDKTEFEDYKESALATHDILYDCKLDKTEFEEYREGALATHDILFNEVGKKLDKGWTKLGEEKITQDDVDEAENQGKSGVMVVGIPCGDLSKYTELMARLEIPENTLNSANSQWQVGLSDSVYVLDGDGNIAYQKDGDGELILDTNGNPIPILNLPSDANGYLVHQYGYSQFMLSSATEVNLCLTSKFIDGYHNYTEIAIDYYGTYKSYMGNSIPAIDPDAPLYYPTKLKGKTTYWFTTEKSGYKLPPGTVIKVYGR